METWDAIRARRNVRRYAPDPIGSDELDRILEAGRRAPSASNRQRWDFVVCTERELLKELASVWQGARHVAGSAATIALIAPVADDPKTRESIAYDLGQVTMYLALAATDLGIGSGHAAVRDRELASSLLGLPDDRYCAWMLALGHPAERPLAPIEHPDRRPFDDVVHRNGW